MVRYVRNYLRARGEYRVFVPMGASIVELPPRTRRIRSFIYPWCERGELPPRTRRIQAWSSLNNSLGGTTSAHAENTTRWAE